MKGLSDVITACGPGALGLLAFVVLAAGCRLPEDAGSAVPPEAMPRLLVVAHGADVYSEACYEQVARALDEARMPFDRHDLAADTSLPDLGAYAAVLTTTEMLGALTDGSARRLEAFVQGGGGLATLYRAWDERLAPLWGLENREEPGFLEVDDETLVFEEALMPGADGLRLPHVSLSSIDLQVRDAADVLARVEEDGRPVLWRHPYGRGQVLYWNTALLANKPFRGFVTQSVAAVQSRTLQPLANWAVVYIDDFPNSASNDSIEPVRSEYGTSVAEFYAGQWYSDVRGLAERYGITYTSTVVFNYDVEVDPPFRFAEWLNGTIRAGGRDVAYSPWIAARERRVSELALHGYNHLPLTLENWGSKERMVQALQAARRRWTVDQLGAPPRTYVPPMNEIDSVGVAALREVFPEMDVLAGLYLGQEVGQNREYGPERWDETFYALPRITSGYIMTPYQRALMLSVLHLNGTWGHFIHPDDVFPNEHRAVVLEEAGIEVDAEGMRWRNEPHRDGLYYQFRGWLDFMETHYPWLQYVEAQEAAEAMRRYDALQWTRRDTPDAVDVGTTSDPSFFLFQSREGERVERVRGGEVLYRTTTALGSYAVVRLDRRRATLELTPEASP